MPKQGRIRGRESFFGNDKGRELLAYDVSAMMRRLLGGRGDIVNCQSAPSKTGSLSVSSYSSHSMMAVHYVLLSPSMSPEPVAVVSVTETVS